MNKLFVPNRGKITIIANNGDIIKANKYLLKYASNFFKTAFHFKKQQNITKIFK